MDKAEARGAARMVDVPAHGARSVHVRVRATRPGRGVLVVTTHADGAPDDVLRHTWDIAAAGEKRVLTRTSWVDGDRKLVLALDHGYRLADAPRIVLERGYDDAIAAALDALEPERQTSTAALVDAYEAAVRIERWAIARTPSTPRHRVLATMAHASAERALGRYRGFAELDGKASHSRLDPTAAVLAARVSAVAREVVRAAGPNPGCPPGDDALDVEPAPMPDVLPCWGAYVADTTRALEARGDPERLARAILALAEREHRAAIATSLVEQLRRAVELHPNGEIEAPGLVDRADRATVYAALLRAQRFGRSAASSDALFAQIAVLRDVTGGYGSSYATLAVVRALLASQLEGHGTTRARVRAEDGSGAVDREIDVPESGATTIVLPPGALAVDVHTEGPGVVARLERPVLRLWSRPPPPEASPIAIETIWPADVRAGGTALLRIVLRHGRDESVDVDVRAPLPPGVTLAAATADVAQLQGVLAVRRAVGVTGAVVEVPLRFALSGTMTAPEAIARLTRSPAAAAVAPARRVVVHVRPNR